MTITVVIFGEFSNTREHVLSMLLCRKTVLRLEHSLKTIIPNDCIYCGKSIISKAHLLKAQSPIASKLSGRTILDKEVQ